MFERTALLSQPPKYASDPESAGIAQTNEESIVTTTKTKLLRRPQVEDRTGLSCSSIYQAIKNGTFPKPISIGPRAVAWLEDEIQNWIDERTRLTRG